MAKVRKATNDEKAGYKGLYVLYGYVKVDGQQCAVEYLGEGHDNPNYEVMAPTGQHFVEGVHSLLCGTLADLQDRLQPLEPCTKECDCEGQ